VHAGMTTSVRTMGFPKSSVTKRRAPVKINISTVLGIAVFVNSVTSHYPEARILWFHKPSFTLNKTCIIQKLIFINSNRISKSQFKQSNSKFENSFLMYQQLALQQSFPIIISKEILTSIVTT
jgi:hypothetical protein